MAVWPFGKRSRRVDGPPDSPQPLTRNKVSFGYMGGGSIFPSRRLSRKNSKRRRSPTRRKGNTEMQNPEINVLRPIAPLSPFGSATFGRRGSVEDITALPISRELQTSPHLRPKTEDNADIPYDFRLYSSASRTSTPQPVLEPQGKQPQKLRNKLSRGSSRQSYGADLPRKLSKKKNPQQNAVREEEIRAMSAPAMAPRRTSAHDSGPLVRENKQFRGGLNRNLERPISNISIPHPDSGPASSAAGADGRAYRISVLDIMAPRPIIRVSEPYAISALGSGAWSGPSRTNSKKRTPVPPSTADTGPKSKRVDSLADELDSTELRAAMERDRKRKEQKREREAARLKRRLERRAERQRAKEDQREEAEAAASGQPTGTKEVVGLGIAPGSPSAPNRAPPPPPQTEDIEASVERASSLQKSPELEPRRQEQHVPAGFAPLLSSQEEIPQLPLLGSEDGDVETPLASPSLVGFHPTFFPASPKDDTPRQSLYQGQLQPQLTPLQSPDPVSYQPRYQPSESTPAVTALPPIPEGKPRRSSFLFNLFHRGDKRKSRSMSESQAMEQTSGSSFSNTSRGALKYRLGSSPAPQLQLHSQVPTTPGSRSGTPMRSRSVFQEHLPELKPHQKTPPSPPVSRLHSPLYQDKFSSPDTIRGAMITPTSHHRISEQSKYDQDEASRDNSGNKSPTRLSNPLSQSLASVDSEGSWLTGKPVKRGLSNRSGLRSPGPDSAVHQASHSHPSHSEDDHEPIMEDEYFRRLAAGKAPEEDDKLLRSSGLEAAASVAGRKPSSEAVGKGGPYAGGDTDDERTNPAQGVVKGHGQVARQAEIRKGVRVKSSEGLLRDAIAAGESNAKLQSARDDAASPDFDSDDQASPDLDHPKLHRATSVKTSKLTGENPRLVDVGKKTVVQDAGSVHDKPLPRIPKEYQI